MSQSVLVTIPDELVEDFINHLGRMKPEKAKHITIRVLDDILQTEPEDDLEETFWLGR